MEGGTLEKLWKCGKKGYLSPLEQVKAWALSEAGKDPAEIAEKVVKIGGGHPSREAIRQLLDRIDEDPDWYPGKRAKAEYGRKPVLRGTKRKQVAATAMRLKKQGVEPTYSSIVANCPAAVRNPDTGVPVRPNSVYAVLKEDCYDRVPACPWNHERVLSRTAISEAAKEQRLRWACWMVGENHTAGWFFQNVIWVDLCNSILPNDKAKAWRQTMARKGGKRWHSPDAKHHSRNLQMNKTPVRQCAWGDEKVWWLPLLTRGKLHIEVLPEDFPGEKSTGVGIAVRMVPGVLAKRFPGERGPKALFCDRGIGFYNPKGSVTAGYAEALAETGLRNFMGDTHGLQPGDVPDLLIHETAVSWIRTREEKTKPKKAWEETREDFSARMKAIARDINETCDVAGLCRSPPKRFQECVSLGGERLRR